MIGCILDPRLLNVFHAQLNWARNFNCSWMLKYRQIKKFFAFSLSDIVFIMLINVNMPTIVGILTFMSRMNFVLSRVKHKNSFITSEPELWMAQSSRDKFDKLRDSSWIFDIKNEPYWLDHHSVSKDQVLVIWPTGTWKFVYKSISHAKNSEYDQEIPQSETADKPVAPLEEPQNNHETPGKQSKQSNLSSPSRWLQN